ncbi:MULTISPECIES: DUF6085 family protein [unclassified Cryobacterium]|uniref:DUF6085 family protein n=1 Tax=unclassified Cryobacterium TaxID=2649013 RepID=UPI001580BD23|nr:MULTISPECIES: DUF6085 family protein [unclassified Cryobacterium]
MISVIGNCPMGCGRTLAVDPHGAILCRAFGCPNSRAATTILQDAETEHVVTFARDDFTIKHPLRERIGDELLDCPMHAQLAALTEPPVKPGRYRVQTDSWGETVYTVYTALEGPASIATGVECRRCGYLNVAHTAPAAPLAQPSDGDLSICFVCGELGIFVISVLGMRLRVLTAEELDGALRDPVVIWVMSARMESAEMDPGWPKAPRAMSPDSIAALLSDSHVTYANEDDLQAGLHAALTAAGIASTREVRLSDGISRIDLVCGTVGIEVKIKGSAASVYRQLKRYSLCDELSALILVTTKASHHPIAQELNGKPVLLVSLIEGGL